MAKKVYKAISPCCKGDMVKIHESAHFYICTCGLVWKPTGKTSWAFIGLHEANKEKK